MDGYLSAISIERYEALRNLCEDQIKINKNISDASNRINSINIPENMNRWIDSLNDPSTNNFKLSDLKQMFDINREYEKLIEMREKNASKIKSLVIDNLIDKIKNLLDR